MELLELTATFFRIGLFSFGGGYAMIPLIEVETVLRHQWLERVQFVDIIAIAEMTPGPIAVNSATFVGYKVAGVAGSAAATLGVILPSIIIVLLLATLFEKRRHHAYVAAVLRGVKPVVVSLIFLAGVSVFKKSITDLPTAAVGVLAFVVTTKTRINPILILVGAGVLGALFF
ncbi:MAG: chromate transporter [Bacillota bacterium]